MLARGEGRESVLLAAWWLTMGNRRKAWCDGMVGRFLNSASKAFLLILAMMAVQTAPTPAAEPGPGVGRVAVLDFQNRSGSSMSSDEALYLSDLARGTIRASLPASRYLMMTRENMLELLPAGRTMSDCLGECAVETGRKLGADFVVTGEVTAFAGQIRVAVNMHETAHSNLLGQVVVGGKTVLDVEADLKVKLAGLLAPLRASADPGVGVTEGVIGGGAKAFVAGGVAKVVVSFGSQPPGALAEVNGQPVGETPCSRAMLPGVYRVGIKKVRYVAHEQVLEVKAGAAPKIDVTLTPDFGWLSVETDPEGLPVTIDDEAVGNAPVSELEMAPGPHDIMVAAADYVAEGRRIIIDRNERESVRIAPVPRNGGISVLATDAKGNAVAAAVKVDGRTAGQAYQPITVLQGRHEVTVEGGGSRWIGSVTVAEGQVLEVAAKLDVRAVVLSESPGFLGMVEIPAGKFMAGSPASEVGHDSNETLRLETIARDFLISATEVTQAQFLKVMGTNPSQYRGNTRPVEQVTWYEAVEFCNRLSSLEGLQPAYRIAGRDVEWDVEADGYRLPTLAEWEFACRAGTNTAYALGRDEAALGQAGWYDKNSDGETHPVAKKKANAWGLYDMHGNVWEWCWDESGGYRAYCGGSWLSSATYCRSANRTSFDASYSFGFLGFRVVRNSGR